MGRRLQQRVDDEEEGIEGAAEGDVLEAGPGLAGAMVDRACPGVLPLLDLIGLGGVALRRPAAHDQRLEGTVRRKSVLLLDLAHQAAQVQAEPRPVGTVRVGPNGHLAVAYRAPIGSDRPHFSLCRRLRQLIDRRLSETGRGEKSNTENEICPNHVGSPNGKRPNRRELTPCDGSRWAAVNVGGSPSERTTRFSTDSALE